MLNCATSIGGILPTISHHDSNTDVTPLLESEKAYHPSPGTLSPRAHMYVTPYVVVGQGYDDLAARLKIWIISRHIFRVQFQTAMSSRVPIGLILTPNCRLEKEYGIYHTQVLV